MPESPKKPTANAKLSVPAMVMNYMRTMRENFMRKLTGQKRDLEEEFGHPKTLDASDYWEKFERGDIADRIVSLYPEECFKTSPLVYETEDEEETPFELEWNAIDDELGLTSFLLRADKISGVGRYGVIVLGLDDGKQLHEAVPGFPEPKIPKPGETPQPPPDSEAEQPQRRLLYLRVFDESVVKIVQLENNPANPRFGQPILYEIEFWQESINNSAEAALTPVPQQATAAPLLSPNSSTKTSFKVHWQRVIHLADNRLRDEIYGTPRLKKTFDRVLDLHKIAGSSAEMYYKGAFMGIALEQNETDEPIEMTPEEKEATKKEMEEYYEGLKRYISLNGMKANPLAPQVADPGPAAELQIRLIAMAMACPWRVFMGSEQAQLASGQDMKEWNQRLEKRRTEYVNPKVIRPFVDRLIILKVLPFPKGKTKPKPKAPQGEEGQQDREPQSQPQPQRIARPDRPQYLIFWEPLGAPSELEQADVAVKKTDAMAKYVAGSVDQLIDPPHYMELVMGFSKEETDAIMDEVGDRLIETDPEAEAEQAAADAEMAHKRDLEKIEAAGAAKAAVGGGNGNGFPARK